MMMALFRGSERSHGIHGAPTQDRGKKKWEIKRSARTVEGPATAEAWARHLSADSPLGIPPLLDDGTCLWGSIDVDSYEDNGELVAAATDAGLVPARSKSGGLHLFLFLAEPMAAAEVQAILAALRDQLGLPESTEIFPKQTSASNGSHANWLCMPYLGTTFEGRLSEQHGLRRNGLDMTLGEFLRVAEKSWWKAADARGIVRSRSAVPTDDSGLPLPGAPRCLREKAAAGIEEGERNDTLLAMGIYAKRQHPRDWKERLDEYNRLHLRPPLPSEEVSTAIRSLTRKDFEYKRNGRPICAGCTRPECLLALAGAGTEHAPAITRIVQIPKDPPLWSIWIGNQVVENLSTEDAYNFRRFAKVCLERLRLPLPKTTGKAWEQMWQTVEIEVGDSEEDVGADDAFRQLLEDFLVNRTRGERIEDILVGRPWEDTDERRHYFRMADLMKSVQREADMHLRKVADSSYIRRQIRGLGGDCFGNRTIKGKTVRLWWVPSEAFQPTPTPDTRAVPDAGV